METREYFSVPITDDAAISTVKSRYGGVRTEQREAGTSGSCSGSRVRSAPFNPKLASTRWATFMNQRTLSPRSVHDGRPRLFVDSWDDGAEPYFLDSCFLCKRPLRHDRDIYMYRGDIPFCSEECRKEQIETDETKESRSMFLKTSISREGRKNNSSPSVKVRSPGTTVAG